MSDTKQDAREKAQRVSVSLFPRHIRTIQQFAAETQRSDSNAVQFIIEDWARKSCAAPQPDPEPAR